MKPFKDRTPGVRSLSFQAAPSPAEQSLFRKGAHLRFAPGARRVDGQAELTSQFGEPHSTVRLRLIGGKLS